MGKKVALILVMMMLANMVIWAEEESDAASEEEAMALLVGIGIVAVVSLLVGGLIWLLSEADAPDDGMRLASMQNENTLEKTGFDPVLNMLNHVEVGQTQNDKIYVGFRFQF